MSPIVTLVTRVRDPVGVASACRRLSLPPPVQGTVRLPGGEANGLIVQLPGWKFPIFIDTDTGTIRYDIDSNLQGEFQQLSRFLWAYTLEQVKGIARTAGVVLSESRLPDGSIRPAPRNQVTRPILARTSVPHVQGCRMNSLP